MAVDYFLEIDGIKGESEDKTHPGTIHLESFSFGETNAGTFASGTGGGGAGKCNMQDFHFTMSTNKASPLLFLACATGQHIKKAILYARKAGGEQQDYMKWTFSDVLCSSWQESGSAHGESLPIESISLNFAKIEVEYKPQKPDGSLDAAMKAGYDCKKQTKV